MAEAVLKLQESPIPAGRAALVVWKRALKRSGRVLVTNAQQRKSLATVRALGRHGILVTAAERTKLALSFFSRYVDKAVVYPDPRTQPDAFLDWLFSLVSTVSYDVVFPMDDDVLEIVTQHLPELRRYVRIPVVDYQRYTLASDKLHTVRIAETAGVLCPKTIVVDCVEEVERLAPTLNFPVVLKPRISSGSRGLAYVLTSQELSRAWEKTDREYPRPLIQEYVPPGGRALGVSALLSQDSRPLAVFVHQRLREFPVSGGPSTLCESVHADDLANEAIRLLQHLKWFGVAMVEFKTDPRDGLPRLMEINPRFWGSLQLAICCGIDFPWLLYRLAMDNDIDPMVRYPAGKRYRWLPGDILHFLTNGDRWKIAADFFRYDGRRTCYDVPSTDDWWPNVGLAVTLGHQAVKSMLRRDALR